MIKTAFQEEAISCMEVFYRFSCSERDAHMQKVMSTLDILQ
jgi:hypothetical protein